MRNDQQTVGVGKLKHVGVRRARSAKFSYRGDVDKRFEAADGEDDLEAQVFVGQEPRPAHGLFPGGVDWVAADRTRCSNGPWRAALSCWNCCHFASCSDRY